MCCRDCRVGSEGRCGSTNALRIRSQKCHPDACGLDRSRMCLARAELLRDAAGASRPRTTGLRRNRKCRAIRPFRCSKAACPPIRSEEHTSELRHANISYAVFCLKKKKTEYLQSSKTKIHISHLPQKQTTNTD